MENIQLQIIHMILNKLWLYLGSPKIHENSKIVGPWPIYPPLFGVEVKQIVDDCNIFGMNHYYELNKLIPFTGKMMLGSDFLSEYYIHMGFQQAWAYKTVKELEFENGHLININDYSDRVDKIRKHIKDKQDVEDLHDDILGFVRDSFSRSYEDKVLWLNQTIKNEDNENG